MTHRPWISLSLFSLLAIGACTGSDGNDTAASNIAATAEHSSFKTAFTTKKRVLGETIGGLAGADKICSDIAAAAKLKGTFKAWLSDATTSAASRFNHASVPYLLVNGAQVAADFDDLTDGTLDHALDRDEHGALIDDKAFQDKDVAWSATRPTGEVMPWDPTNTNPTDNPRFDCGMWSTDKTGVGMLGVLTSTDVDWSETDSGISCDETAHLYCFEQ